MEAKQETVLTIEGMTCGHCQSRVKKALESVEGVSQVDVDLEAGEACVVHDPRVAPVSRLVGAVTKAGYGASEAR